MNEKPFLNALIPELRRQKDVVREHEVLRIAAIIDGDNIPISAEAARCEVLKWAQRRCGGSLPNEAWAGNSFDLLAGGRNTIGVRITNPEIDLWAIRGDDPDKYIPGRVWTTEVSVGYTNGRRPRLGLRLLVNTLENELNIEPHSPGLIQQISETCGLFSGPYPLSALPKIISSECEVDDLIAMLEDPARKWPVIVASGDQRRSDPDSPLIDSIALARATVGLAHVYVVPAKWTYALTDYFGKTLSVFFGAVRTYNPGLSGDSHPYDHQLFLGDNLQSPDGVNLCIRTLRSFVARESLRRTRIGDEVLSFAAVRNVAMQTLQQQQIIDGAPDAEKLLAAEERIIALEEQIKSSESWEHQLSELHDEAEMRAKASEAQANAATYRIQTLLKQLEQSPGFKRTNPPIPEAWSDLEDWCDKNLSGKLVLAPVARRRMRRPIFPDVQLAARCLQWLADTCRERLIEGGGSIKEEVIENGIRNAACGNDSFDFQWQHKKLSANWHVKNGGNVRNPERCLRIYFGWDAETQQIIVADMPAHRRTGAT